MGQNPSQLAFRPALRAVLANTLQRTKDPGTELSRAAEPLRPSQSPVKLLDKLGNNTLGNCEPHPQCNS